MDSFYASVEQLDHAELAGRPVIVGGSGPRGVVASCSYEARAFGVASAMPSLRAAALCPAAVFVPPRFSRYRELSELLSEILHSFTPLVEPLGLDEAFLDVRGARRLLGSPVDIAGQIRAEVARRLSLSCSIGVGRTKLVAKLASRAAKPRASAAGVRPGPGIVVVEPHDEVGFLSPMAVEALWGVGPATARRLHDLGIVTVADLAQVPEEAVVRRLGAAHGRQLVALARGIDPREVVAGRTAKSLGHEETFTTDVVGRAALVPRVQAMAETVARGLRAQGLRARTVTLKVRFADFVTVTRSRTPSAPVDTGRALSAIATALLDEVDHRAGVRLLGVSAANLTHAAAVEQLSLLPAPHGDDHEHPGQGHEGAAVKPEGRWVEVEAALDAVAARFGPGQLGRGPIRRSPGDGG